MAFEYNRRPVEACARLSGDHRADSNMYKRLVPGYEGYGETWRLSGATVSGVPHPEYRPSEGEASGVPRRPTRRESVPAFCGQ